MIRKIIKLERQGRFGWRKNVLESTTNGGLFL